MPTDHLEIAIDQNRDIETENSDAFGNLPDLFLAVQTCVRRVRFELVQRAVDDLQTWLLARPSGGFQTRIYIHMNTPTLAMTFSSRGYFRPGLISGASPAQATSSSTTRVSGTTVPTPPPRYFPFKSSTSV